MMLPSVRRKKKHRTDTSCREVGISLNTTVRTHLTIITTPCYAEGSISQRSKDVKKK